MQVCPGVSDDFMHETSIRVEGLQDRDRVCVLKIDEMSLKSNLSYDKLCDVIYGFHDCGKGFDRQETFVTSALVFMVRGLSMNWKQSDGYVLTHSPCKGDTLPNILYQFLDKLREIGLPVKLVFSDQGSNFQNFVSPLHVSIKIPYFVNNGQKYWYMF